MKKWSGGTLILALAMILVLRYSFMESHPQKQSPFGFFKDLSENGTRLEGNDISRPAQLPEILEHSKRPRLISVEGVDGLYSWSDISEAESRVKLVWSQMQHLISRSDSLPETAQGVKEASIAWKDLVATLEKEKSLSAINNSLYLNDTEDQNCPFSFSVLNSTSLTNGSLKFPCGLVQDSSISIVGIPTEHNGSFQIELVGSQLPGELDSPVILHYNVSLQGDSLMRDPVILQNTWTADHGWGVEERCPANAASGNTKVDGLVRCNEQVGGTIRDETVNGSQLSSRKLLVSKGSGHISYSFPFVEGHPFTATLWVGVDGFHMTVNGRHETSFAYRERLEPWLVSGVRVAGGLDVLSFLANGLPVIEDPGLVVDVKYLKAPPVPKKRLLLLVGVFSTGNNFERRMAIRRSWMQYEAIRSGDVAVRFFIGLHKNGQVNVELWKEAQRYGDIQLMPFVDYYSLITLKTIAICFFGTKILPAKYIMKTDDDAFVRIDQVLSILKEKKVSDGLLYGLISFDSTPHRDKDSKWYISEKEWPHASYPPWAHGPGYIISRDIAKFIVQGHQERNLKLFKLEDVAMGIWVEQYKKRGRKVHYMTDDRFHNAGCESDYILAHYQGPRLMLCLWEKLQKEHQPICCE
ncbi:hydroxyproline O-galactosyltransferase GALT3-like isoform X1 [Magnolia sinica]|uniref:hydroxyproline O-galactosyltransferase GALT3-like isoform X1 n=1 Tax=Magnolia sinica TaxID=86752 RepID=UPI00265AAB3B|nr:hydroxyproline O-galactosyltransferase GALT3-like isoform X1 [Magnolia sinica]